MARSSHPNEVVPPMPGNVRSELSKKNLMDAFLARPDYQRRDYLKAIEHAFGTPAKQKVIDQLLADLEHGKQFQGQPWDPPEPIKK
ncbi:MAG: hypothetical protein ABI678_05900 [Kofleriaceae bacterium]